MMIKKKGYKVSIRWIKMKECFKFHRLMIILMGIMLVVVPSKVFAVPTRTQCSLWDESYRSLFYYFLLGTFISCLIFPFIVALMGRRRWWWTTAPRQRIIIVYLVIIALSSISIIAIPIYSGFSWEWPPGLAPAYMECKNVNFGAEGLFGGRIAAGHPIFTAWPILFYSLVGSGSAGALVAFAWTELRRRLLWRT